MDRNSIIGLSIIGLLIVGYSIYNQPGEAELKALKHKQDSIAAVEAKRTKEAAINTSGISDTIAVVPVSGDTLSDSTRVEMGKQEFGDFAPASTGTEQILTLENKLIKLSISSRGGMIKGIELKKYKTWDGKPVVLMADDSSYAALTFSAQNRIINTGKLFFQASGTSGSSNTIHMKLPAGENRYIEYVYKLEDDSYMFDFSIIMTGMQDLISSNAGYLNFDWKDRIHSLEKSLDNERVASTIYYRFADEDVDYLSYTSDKTESIKTRVKWISFKQQFFNVSLIAENAFESPTVETVTDKNSPYVKTMSASFGLPFERKQVQTYNMRYYAGPNHYQTLKKIDHLNLEKLIPLGWGIFGWVNKFLVIPTFNFLDSFHINYGIIILILTILVRVILLPLTYGSFKSQAKMRVLQPEMAEINEKFKDDPMKKQQEVMSMYRKAGVNPLGGCIPGLLQLPILIAMFRFFPSSIELRQQPFLWAHDLSTYDSILDLPFKIPFYGSHVSLFTLLMTVSTLIYTRMNMAMSTAVNPQMKWMMYLMPVMFLGFFNNYSAGLSYYYFLSNIFGFGLQYLFKAFIDEDAMHRQIQENRKKPVKKSGFQQRLEQMQQDRNTQVRKKR